MSTEDRSTPTRLWIALVAFTLVNLGVWVSSGIVHRPDPGLVQVDHSTTAAGFERTGRLVMSFDRAVFEEDQIGRSFDRPPFRIDPPIAGSWMIEDREVVAFRPAAHPPAGRIYRVGLAPSHPLFHRFEFDQSTLPELRYRPLELEKVQLAEVSSTAEGVATSATIELGFDQAVRPADVADATTITVDGRNTTPSWQPAETPTSIRCTVPVVPGAQLSVQIDENLTARDGLLGLGDQVRRSFAIAGTLVDLGSSTYEDKQINIRFDRRLEPSQRLPTVTISPDPGAVSTRIQDKWLIIRGSFERRRTYEVRIDPPLLAVDDSVLTETVVRRVTIDPPRPSVRALTTNGQMMPGGSLQIPVRHFGHSSMWLEIHRLVDAHLPMVLAELVRSRRIDDVGETVFEGSVPLVGDPDDFKTSILDLATYTDGRPGLYEIVVRPEGDYWYGHDSTLLVSDLAIEIQRTDEEILAWVTSIADGTPVENATVTAWAPNITPIESGTTDRDGLIRLPLDGDPCRVVTATNDDQLVFVRTSETRGQDDRRFAGAEWSGPLTVSLHADRGVHRPGEVVHVSGILRTDDGQVPPGTPLSLRWIRPDKRVATTVEAITEDSQGTFSVDLPTDPLDPTGHWMVECRIPGAEERLARIECPIMPFLPVRLEVATGLETSGSVVEATVSAKYLHGAPAADLPAKVVTRFVPIRFESAEHPDHVFAAPTGSETVIRKSTALLDDAGTAIFPIDPPTSPGTWRVVTSGSVAEPGGRSTSSTKRGVFDGRSRHRGLRMPGGLVHRPDMPIEVDVLDIVDGSIEDSAAAVIRVERVTRKWYRVRESNRWRWRNRESLAPVGTQDIELVDSLEDGSRRHRIPGLPDGEYRITATSDDHPDVPSPSLDIRVSRWNVRGGLAMERPDRIEVIPGEGPVRPGDDVTVLLRTPFTGTMLVTVETDRIHDAQVVRVDGDGIYLDLDVPTEVRDTCFVNATLIRRVDPDRESWQPVLARGAARLPIDRSPHRIETTLIASDGARPGEVVRVSLSAPDAGAGTMARIWAVEEGALLATGFEAPDPVEDLLRDRRKTTLAASTLSDLLEDFERPMDLDRIGGDAARSRREPVPVRIPETRVIWRAYETLGEDGILDVDFEMPDIDGAMRIMAVVVDDDRYGASQRKIAVTSPIEVLATLPRSAAPGDRMSVPVRIRNNTLQARTLEMSIEAGDGLVIADHPAVLTIDAGEMETIDLDIEARDVGPQPIVIRAVDRDGSSETGGREEWSIAVRPTTTRRFAIQRILAQGGETISIERDRNHDWLDERISVGIACSPEIDLAPIVDELIRYPYGCCEQIGSTVQGLLAALESPTIAGDHRTDVIRRMASKGLFALWQRQLSNGRLPYWSSGSGNDWLTMRTALIAQKARALEIPMPEDFVDGLVDATGSLIRNRNLPQEQQAMACHILASAGRPDPAVMKRLDIDRTALSLGARADLAQAFGVLGSTSKAREIIATFRMPPSSRPRQSGYFTSDGTDVSLALIAALEHHPESDVIGLLYDGLVGIRTESGWRTTYENAAAVSALGMFGRRYKTSESATGTIEVAGRRISYEGPDALTRSWTIPEPRESERTDETVTATGDAAIHTVVTISGFPRFDSDPEEHRGIEVRRSWMNVLGEPIEAGRPIEAGDVVLVEVEWRSTVDRAIPNMAIVEVLPGGMEFELPALITSASTATDLDSVDHAEFRDDRLLAFATAETNVKRFRYALRAVVPGTWLVPGTKGEAMYDDTLFSRSPSGTVEIRLP
ncbi:MAG: hypothetical protein GY895_10525 [Phycisphaera sp.]|nr:hypothetical protein [Phycisphaera sp.]